MRPYERPTLILAAPFKTVTGLAARGSRETLIQHQLL
jgi:hypothetical protein